MVARFKLGLMITMLFVASACSSEPKQTQPVTSTSNSGTSTAPPAKEVAERNNALVRVINAVPGDVSFDVFANDQKVFESVAFKSVTPYKELSNVSHAFRVRRAGQDSEQPVAENSENLAGGRHYTIVVMPDTNDKHAIHIVNDNITSPPADKAQVRIINASPDVGEIDVVDKQANKTLFSGVDFEATASYMDVDPMKTTLEVKQEGQQQAITSLPNANFEKGKFYTIVVTGLAKGAPKVQTLMVEDQLGSAPTAAVPSQDAKMQRASASN
jgi:hypothetical protein